MQSLGSTDGRTFLPSEARPFVLIVLLQEKVMSKATQVESVIPPLQGGKCVICGKKLQAPWGRNGLNGMDWVCSDKCQKEYDARYRRWACPAVTTRPEPVATSRM